MKPCRLFQKLISWQLEGDRHLPRFLSTHVDRCPECGAFVRSRTRVEFELRRTASQPIAEPSPFLRNRIEARLGEIEQRPPAYPWAALAQFACGILIVSVLAVQGWNLREARIAKAQASDAIVASLAPSNDPLLQTLPSGKTLAQWKAELSQPPVLEMEMELALADARKAVELLVNEFVPKSLRTSLAFAETRAQ